MNAEQIAEWSLAVVILFPALMVLFLVATGEFK
jgi:hypothetical protein